VAVRVGLIGAGWIGRYHGASLARRIPGAELVAIADPALGAAAGLAKELGCAGVHTDASELLADSSIDAVVVAAPAASHADLVVAASAAGKAVFCEKPMALTLADADRAIDAAARAGVPLQVGFNRRYAADFRAAYDVVATGGIGQPQLLRSLTRDPVLADPSVVRPWAVFLETLIHDFDTLCWLNPGAEPVEVYAMADALVRPDWKQRGLLDTAVVLVRFDNGALGTAEASFQAVYGYDVRGEVFGSAGMVTAGEARRTTMAHYRADGYTSPTVRLNTELFHDAYTAELESFVDGVATGVVDGPTGQDARRALAVALAAIGSVRSGAPVAVKETRP
jgi:myo-inositol 2-dehydrogenase/D-chiro-inositol 1-dehydrogenase